MTFLTKAKLDTVTSHSGLKVLPINDATGGVHADTNATVYAKFMGYYIDSLGLPVIFQSTIEDGKPYEFQLGRNDLIKGMKEALSQLPEGQVAKLFIPSTLAYGTTGVSGLIPRNKDLIFDIQILKVINGPGESKKPVRVGTNKGE
jgi:peptidylprolyl isomerase